MDSRSMAARWAQCFLPSLTPTSGRSLLSTSKPCPVFTLSPALGGCLSSAAGDCRERIRVGCCLEWCDFSTGVRLGRNRRFIKHERAGQSRLLWRRRWCTMCRTPRHRPRSDGPLLTTYIRCSSDLEATRGTVVGCSEEETEGKQDRKLLAARDFFDKDMVAPEKADLMKMWPGPSTPPEFEFGFQTQNSYISEEDEETQLTERDDKISYSQDDIECRGKEGDIEWNSRLGESSWDPYLGDLTITERDEDPTEYVPSPPILAEDMDMRDKVEALLYTLKELMPGSLDFEKVIAAVPLFSSAVEVQNPLICFRGTDGLEWWLKILTKAVVAVDLHEVYSETLTQHRFKRRVYAVWTITLTGDSPECRAELQIEPDGKRIETEGPDAALPLSSSRGDGTTGESETNRPTVSSGALHLSGESVFEMDRSGLVTSVHSTWYVMREDGEAIFEVAKLWLAAFLSRAASDS